MKRIIMLAVACFAVSAVVAQDAPERTGAVTGNHSLTFTEGEKNTYTIGAIDRLIFATRRHSETFWNVSSR